MIFTIVAKSHSTSFALMTVMFHYPRAVSTRCVDCITVPTTLNSSGTDMSTVILADSVSDLFFFFFWEIYISLQSILNSLVLLVNQICFVWPPWTRTRSLSFLIECQTIPTKFNSAHFAFNMVASFIFFDYLTAVRTVFPDFFFFI